MKKRIKGRRFSRKEGARKGLVRSLLRSLFLQGKIQTTEAKAKEIAPLAEKLLSKAKEGGLRSRRQLGSLLGKEIAKKMIEELAPQYQARKGGYTRIFKLAQRKSNGARMASIELIS